MLRVKFNAGFGACSADGGVKIIREVVGASVGFSISSVFWITERAWRNYRRCPFVNLSIVSFKMGNGVGLTRYSATPTFKALSCHSSCDQAV